MVIPEQWRDYLCEDYFGSTFAIDGYLDESAQVWLIEPAHRVREDVAASFLQVGRPGVDDIGFGYRKGKPGFWAYHRIVSREFQYVASTIQEFVEGWQHGQISI